MATPPLIYSIYDTNQDAVVDAHVRSLFSASAPLVYSNITGQFSIPKADATHDGYLASTDWNHFNGDFIPILDGHANSDASGSVVEVANFLTGLLKSPQGGAHTVDWGNAVLFDPVTSNQTVDWSACELNDATTVKSLWWGVRTAWDSSGLQSFNWDSRQFYDSSGLTSIDWDNRILFASDGVTPVLSWDATVTNNTFFGGAASGAATRPSFRALVASDIPALGYVPTSRLISTTSPLAGGGDLSANRTLTIANAAANGTTLGAATFTAADFNDNGAGLISLDYTNGQKATAGQPGFLMSADWSAFSGKQNALSFPLAATLGGTGLATVTTGDLLYGSAANTWANLADVATGNVLLSGGVGVAPAWGQVSLTAAVTGVLPIANGGTNNAGPFTAGSVIFSNGTLLTQDNSKFFWDDTAFALCIGTVTQAGALTIVGNGGVAGQAGCSITGGAGTTGAGGGLILVGGSGGTSTTGGAGGGVQLNGGAAGTSTGLHATAASGGGISFQGGTGGVNTSAGTSGVGGSFGLVGGAGGGSGTSATGGTGGACNISSGAGGTNSSTGNAGKGGLISITGNVGGGVTGAGTAGAGGSITLTAGAAGSPGGSGTGNNGGSVTLIPGAATGAGTAGAIVFGNAAAQIVNFVAGSGAAAPSTSVGVAIVNFYGTSATNFLGTPRAWMSIQSAGAPFLIPLY